jgi:hypothetical protein
VPEQRFSRPWSDPRLKTALAEVGVEIPEQLGALFIGDANYLRGLAGVEPPLVDDFPQRIRAEGAPQTASVPRAFYRQLMDAREARGRTSLHTLALWSLGTSPAEQAQVAGLASRRERLEELLGLGSLAARDYPAAAAAFARAPGEPTSIAAPTRSPSPAGRRRWRPSPPSCGLDPVSRHTRLVPLRTRGRPATPRQESVKARFTARTG